MEKALKKMQWQVSVAIFKNMEIIKQLGIAIGIPFGLVTLIVGLASGKSIYTVYGLGLIALLLFLTWLFILVIYRGKYEIEFVLDDKGILCRTQVKQARKNRIINSLTVVLGIFSKRPSVVGAGMLAQSRQEVYLKWNRIKKVKYKPNSHTILLRGGLTESMALFCTEDNYLEIKQFIGRMIS